ncbi:MAG: hypothetical protein HPY73_05820 [Methanomassiliicoccales archaeon]|nr:MAG: hypothetical protein HPY73_05820 [Methanomassiliicoccales archaeon]
MDSFFLDYCVLNDGMRDAAVLAKLRHLVRGGAELYTGTTVLGEAIEVLMEGPREGQYMLIDLVRDLNIKCVHPTRDWIKVQNELAVILERDGKGLIPASEMAHLSLAITKGISAYVTSRPEARKLSGISGLGSLIAVVDIDMAVARITDRLATMS